MSGRDMRLETVPNPFAHAVDAWLWSFFLVCPTSKHPHHSRIDWGLTMVTKIVKINDDLCYELSGVSLVWNAGLYVPPNRYMCIYIYMCVYQYLFAN